MLTSPSPVFSLLDEGRFGIPTFTGTVIANFGAGAAVQDAQGIVHRAIPLKKLPLLVAGDHVTCEGPNPAELRVTLLQTRSSELSRPDRRGQMKPLAANLTRMVVVSAIIPTHDTLLMDQFCVVAETAGIEPVLVINKSDLADSSSLAEAQNLMAVYRDVGYETAIINTQSNEGIAPLLALLQDQTSVLVGQSGVGKSSIVKALLPDLDVRIGAISEATELGAHTTTVSFRYELANGGVLIDSPGVRQFPVGHLSAETLANGYREIASAADLCRFNDCKHHVEPDCGVKHALDDGRIAAFRYQNYRKLSEL